MAYGIVTLDQLPEGLPADALRRWARIEGAPLLRRQVGFRHYHVLALGERRAVNVIIWDSAQAAEAGFTRFQLRLQKSMPGVVTLWRDGGEVALDTAPAD